MDALTALKSAVALSGLGRDMSLSGDGGPEPDWCIWCQDGCQPGCYLGCVNGCYNTNINGS